MKIKLKKLFYKFYYSIIIYRGNKQKNDNRILQSMKSVFKGMSNNSYSLYQKRYGGVDGCLSDRDRLLIRELNGKFNIIFDHKYLNYLIFSSYISMPKIIYYIKDGRFIYPNLSSWNQLEFNLFEKNNGYVIKPISGAEGKGIYFLETYSNQLIINKKKIEFIELKKLLEKGEWIITEYIEQAQYSQRIFAETTNTIRLITLSVDCEPKCVYAVHRFGINRPDGSQVDNWTKGGISAKIDVNNGIITDSIYDNNGKKLSEHPETGKKIVGVPIPRWKSMKSDLLSTHNNFGFIKMIAWDILITDAGYEVIEMNASTGVSMIQVHEKIVDIPLLRNFYREFKY